MEKLSKEVNFKIDKVLCDEVKEIAASKFPLRNISSYADAVREALIQFVKKNQRYKNKTEVRHITSNNQKEQIETI